MTEKYSSTHNADKPTVSDSNNKALCFDVPVYGILCDGSSYHFFSFDSKSRQFSESKGLPLVYISSDGPTARPFVDSLRPICESIFSILLTTYRASLKAHHDRAEFQHKEHKTVLDWYIAFKFADEALRFSQDAEWIGRNESIAQADIRTEQTFSDIKHRYSLSKIRFLFALTIFSLAKVPIAREYVKPSLMDGWSDNV